MSCEPELKLPPIPDAMLSYRFVGSVVEVTLHWRRPAALLWTLRSLAAGARSLGISLWDPRFLWIASSMLVRQVLGC